MQIHRYGIWLFTSQRPLLDQRIFREGRDSYPKLTQFQRHIGVKYAGKREPRTLNSEGFFCAFHHKRPPKAVTVLLKGIFTPGPEKPSKLNLRRGHRKILAKSTGYALLRAPNIRLVSFSGIAHCIGSLLVHT
jgi:hypothetical protein